ncbi:uncharacterized protein [Amphiura filiformis]|uniref:uncharacterized protein isoform X2 n=1 Tax=Amphiura filiformis TaxID=82378 RepID=UPI003B2237AD
MYIEITRCDSCDPHCIFRLCGQQMAQSLHILTFCYIYAKSCKTRLIEKVNANAIRIYENAEIAEYKKKVTDLYDTAAKMGIPHACSPYWGLCYRPRSDEAAIS